MVQPTSYHTLEPVSLLFAVPMRPTYFRRQTGTTSPDSGVQSPSMLMKIMNGHNIVQSWGVSLIIFNRNYKLGTVNIISDV